MKMNNVKQIERSNTEKVNKSVDRVEVVRVEMRYQMRRMCERVRRSYGVMLLS